MESSGTTSSPRRANVNLPISLARTSDTSVVTAYLGRRAECRTADLMST
jgi:hypothetical protein